MRPHEAHDDQPGRSSAARRASSRAGGTPAWIATGQLLLLAIALASAAALLWQLAAPHGVTFAGLAIDRLTALLTLLVAGVGLVTYRYAVRFLHGDPARQRFLGRLTLTVAAAFVLMSAANLLLLLLAWSVVSVGLHGLLTHYRDRPEAIRAARKKFLISRLGDVALLAAVVIARWQWGTFDLQTVLASAVPGSGAAAAIGVLVVVAALTKSAQFPFHSWLPETMESPTPVSALMHAGIINAGGALLLRFAPLIAHVPAALLILSLVGTATLVLGTLAMWAQVKVKRTLAWSTVGQMGFMMTQLGLGAFPAAALHVVAHGCYKAWNFLRCGDVPKAFPAAATLAPGKTLLLAGTGTLLAAPALAAASSVTGFSPAHSPGELALCAILALSCGQVWIAVFRGRAAERGYWAGGAAVAVGLTGLVAFGASALYRAAAWLLAPVLAGAQPPAGTTAWVAAAVPVLAMVGLIVLHAFLPALGGTAAGRALRVHALHGFYFGAAADRIVLVVWKGLGLLERKKGYAHA